MVFLSSIDEKLQHFDEIILKEAASERNRILLQIKNEQEVLINRKKQEFQEQAGDILRKELGTVEREKNNILSRAVTDGRQLLMKTRENIIDSVFDALGKKLETFVRSGSYLSFLTDSIRQACTLAGNGELVVYLQKEDLERISPHIEPLKRDQPRIAALEPTDDAMIGGCRVFNKTAGIFIDNSLLKRMELCKDEFFEISGLRIE